jgi:ankyrin repeat protein
MGEWDAMATPLDAVAAIDASDLPALARALDEGVSPDERDLNCYSLLFLTLRSGHTDSTRLLLARGAGAETPCFVPAVPLPKYVYSQDLPLHQAARSGNADQVRLLVAHGADPNRMNRGVQLAPKRKVFKGTETPLHCAAEAGNLEVVRALLACGAEVDARTGELDEFTGETALLIAVRERRYEVAAALVSAGADPNAARPAGGTPLAIARARNDERMLAVLAPSP